jgi:FMN phosphatase YigB (HAD superfamily)
MSKKIFGKDLNNLWLSSFSGVRVLSLDCFDTLLWRKVATPADVFFAMAHSKIFIEHGITASIRAKAEHAARTKKWVEERSSEVSIEEIYRSAIPSASNELIDALALVELKYESEYCFIYKPVHDILVQAKELGLKTIIVSDTYLSSAQLKNLLFSKIPSLEDVIDDVYCSSEQKMSKSMGIWTKIIPALGVKPIEILHFGDNEDADLKGAERFGMQCAHLVQQCDDAKDIFNSRSQVGVQLLPEIRHTEPFPSYFHAQISASQVSKDIYDRFGYTSIGPILYAFSRFIIDEVEKFKESGKSIKVAFLLRDGFLPALSVNALSDIPVGCRLNISRFTSIAASLNSRDKLVDWLSKALNKDHLPAICKQFLLSEETTRKIINICSKSDDPEKRFSKLILQKETLKEVISASANFRKRLMTHISTVTGVGPGDTLMFVDLGYSGTAQNLLTDIIKEDLQVNLVGRYFIASEVLNSGGDRKGLIDPSWIDSRAIQSMTGNYIAGFEMLCTQNAPSTIDYTEDGKPVYSSSVVSSVQHDVVDRVQKGCINFIRDIKDLPDHYKPSIDFHQLAQSSAIDLSRLLYFPTISELTCLNNFQFDFNLGTDKKIALFDLSAGLADMRKQGFSYMNAGLDKMRTNYPIEMRFLDISLSTLLFSQNRNGFATTPITSSFREEKIKVLVDNGRDSYQHEISANITFDGYFSLLIPLGDSFNVAALIGNNYTWVQIDSIQVSTDKSLLNCIDMPPGESVIFDNMTHQNNGLFKVELNGLIYLPKSDNYQGGKICRIIFRPIAT